jgi:hypothetical protein
MKIYHPSSCIIIMCLAEFFLSLAKKCGKIRIVAKRKRRGKKERARSGAERDNYSDEDRPNRR